MRFIGIDVASETHVVAGVDDQGVVWLKPTSFREDAAGYTKLFELLGQASGGLVAMEATGHYWKNLFAALAARGFAVALLNPLRTRRFAGEDLERAKTDAIDALGIARFAQQKRPAATRLPDSATEELRELVRLRDRLMQDFGDRVRQLHRVVDLGFPEFTRYVRTLDSELATAILHEYPTAQAFCGISVRRLANLRYDGRHLVGLDLAQQLVEAATASVGHHHGDAYRIQAKYACEDIDLLRRRIRDLDRDIESTLKCHEIGMLLTTIDGIGPLTSARLIATFGNPADYKSAGALASFVGIVPATNKSGKRQGDRAGITPIGDSELRSALWMPTLTAVRKNAWLKVFYERLIAAGKLPKVALVASMNKLLGAVYSVAKNRKPFVPRLQPQGAPA